MACKIKSMIYVAALLVISFAAKSCSQDYELDLPLSLNRTDLRFASTGDTYYTLVYCRGDWTAELDELAPWLTISPLKGSGNAQINFTAEMNSGVSRGVTLTIKNGNLTKQLYISQAGGLDEGSYGFVKQSVEVLRAACTSQILAATNLDDLTISHVKDTVEYASGLEEHWLSVNQVFSDKVIFSVDDNTTGEPRQATVKLTFPLAKWDTPVTAFFVVNQSSAEPAQIDATVASLEGNPVEWSDEDKFVILDSDGHTMYSAQIDPMHISGQSAIFIYNSESVASGLEAAVYPEAFITACQDGKATVKMPEKADFITSLDRAASLGIMAGTISEGEVVLNSACMLLEVNINGAGLLKDLSLLFDSPVCGEGTVDVRVQTPVFVPTEGKSSNLLSVNLPSEGVVLPARLYVAVPAGNLGGVTVNANTTQWSGSIRADSQPSGDPHSVIHTEEIVLNIPSAAENLTEGGKWANCYLLNDLSEKMYSIDIKKVDGSVPANDITRCAILWQTSPGVVSYLSIDPSAGKLYFRKSPDLPGNALVAVLNDAGTVRWSYHIWAPESAVKEVVFGQYIFMDRNVGAVAAAAMDHSGKSIGMHYQWGRKDPFPAMESLDGPMKHGKVYPDPISFMTAQNGVPASVAAENPTTYYWGNDNSGAEDWIDTPDDNLWKSVPTNSSPCPYGWAVASKAAFDEFVPRLKEASFDSKVGIVINDDEGNSVLFPVSGQYRRKANASEELASSSEGWIWSSTPYENGNLHGSWYLHIQSTVNNRRTENTYSQRRWGKNVRCVKIN